LVVTVNVAVEISYLVPLGPSPESTGGVVSEGAGIVQIELAQTIPLREQSWRLLQLLFWTQAFVNTIFGDYFVLQPIAITAEIGSNYISAAVLRYLFFIAAGIVPIQIADITLLLRMRNAGNRTMAIFAGLIGATGNNRSPFGTAIAIGITAGLVASSAVALRSAAGTSIGASCTFII